MPIPVRDAKEILDMLEETIERKKLWYSHFRSGEMSITDNAEAIRNYTALRGVEKTLRWVLKQVGAKEPLR